MANAWHTITSVRCLCFALVLQFTISDSAGIFCTAGLECESAEETSSIQLLVARPQHIEVGKPELEIGFPGKFAEDGIRGLWCESNGSASLTVLPTSARPRLSEGALINDDEDKYPHARGATDDVAELEDVIRKHVKLPSHCKNVVDPQTNVKIFTFAIGSLFNKFSVETSQFKGLLKETLSPNGSPSCLNQCTLQNIYDKARPSNFSFAVADGVSRRWTYPSGAPTGFLAVSVHEELGKQVLGGLQDTTFNEVVRDRPRERDYEYIPLDPRKVLVDWSEFNTSILQDAYDDCDPLFPFAYGFKELVNTTSDIFVKIGTLRKKYESESSGMRELISRRNASCAALAPTSTEHCKRTMQANKGFIFIQSYIDVIFSGILEEDPSGAKAEIFVNTTVWPVQDLAEGRLFYINDRTCPQMMNPHYVPPEFLEPAFLGGTSSVWENIEATWAKVDQLLDPTGMLRYRIDAGEGKDCLSLGMGNKSTIVRFTDEFVYGAPNIRHTNQGTVRIVSPWQKPFV